MLLLHPSLLVRSVVLREDNSELEDREQDDATIIQGKTASNLLHMYTSMGPDRIHPRELRELSGIAH